ncbi:uncharacterized protein LOC144461736 [Epinephelus lanceolatus]
MFVCAVALLCLVSVSHSAPLSCEDLLRPLDQLNPHHLKGRWALVAGSLSDPAYLERFKRRNSTSIDFSSFSNATSSVSYTPSVDAGGKCHYHTHNVSVEGSVFTFDVREQVNLTVTFLRTSCPDCLVMRYDNESKKVERLLLFSRRRELEQKEMEEVNAQMECLSMPPPAIMDPNKELCPEQSVSDSAAAQT